MAECREGNLPKIALRMFEERTPLCCEDTVEAAAMFVRCVLAKKVELLSDLPVKLKRVVRALVSDLIVSSV